MPVKEMTGKQKRLMEAARLRYMEDQSNQEIADRLGVSEGTVRNYFSQEDMDQFKRFYSDQELFRLQQQIEQDVKDGDQLANNLLARAIQHEDADDKTYLRASKLALKNRKQKIELLQELGILDKPKERKEITERSTGLEDKLAEAYQELEIETEESDGKSEVES